MKSSVLVVGGVVGKGKWGKIKNIWGTFSFKKKEEKSCERLLFISGTEGGKFKWI